MFWGFLDTEKAFDSIAREFIWNYFKRRKISESVYNNVDGMYKCTTNYMRNKT